ncbi:MAG: hypothetical protein HC915_16215 [Anaerolineae bacterium]|nr:hypothetical protein [Anaerolineae bacterium]
MDELIALAGTSVDEAERTAAYMRIQEILAERGPIIVPYFFAQFMVTDAAVEGIQLHPFAGRTNFNTASFN